MANTQTKIDEFPHGNVTCNNNKKWKQKNKEFE